MFHYLFLISAILGKLSDEKKAVYEAVQSNDTVFAGLNHAKFCHFGNRGFNYFVLQTASKII